MNNQASLSAADSDPFFKDEAFSAAAGTYELFVNMKDGGFIPENANALIIGTHGLPSSAGVLPFSVVHHTKRELVLGNGEQVASQLHDMASQNRRRFEIVLASYELHHIEVQRLPEVMEDIRKLSTHTFVMLDYTLEDMPIDDARRVIKSKNECKMFQRYGSFEQWFQAHKILTHENYQSSIESAGFSSHMNMQLFPTRMLAVGCNGINDNELRNFWQK